MARPSKFVLLIAVCLVTSFCQGNVAKERRCAEARDRIIELSVAAEEKLAAFEPKRERLGKDAIARSVMERIDPEGKFVARCVEEIPDEAVECLIKATKLSDVGGCMK